MDDQLRRLREMLADQFGLETSLEPRKGLVWVMHLLAPKPDEMGEPQAVAAFYLYWLPQEQRFYIQDKRYSTYAPLRERMIDFLKFVTA